MENHTLGFGMSRLVVHDHREGVDKNLNRNRKYQGYHEENIDALCSSGSGTSEAPRTELVRVCIFTPAALLDSHFEHAAARLEVLSIGAGPVFCAAYYARP